MSNHYDFQMAVSRRNTGSYKYDAMILKNPDVSSDAVPLNTADMEFKSPPEMYQGLADYLLTEPVLGYTGPTDDVLQAVVDWMEIQHNYTIEKDWIVHTAGVVNAFQVAIDAFSKLGDGIIVFRPVYYPFGQAIDGTSRKEVNVPLIEKDGYYTIDFDAFEEAASKEENTVLLFCSPHNPVGRVWTREELEKVVDICIRHKVFLISDEIWFEFTQPDHQHIMIGTIDEAINDQLVLCTAMSKSFNVAGLCHSHIIVPNKDVRRKYQKELFRQRQNMVNAIGFQATKLLYRPEGAQWLKEVKQVIYKNMEVVREFFKENHPEIKAPVSEGTYIQWVDFRALGLTDNELETLLDEKAEFFTEHGHVYGEEGSGFERINCALPTEALKHQLEKLNDALNDLKK